MIQSSPFFSARVRRPATSEPPAGSENSWHQIFSPEASGGRYCRFCVLAGERHHGRAAHAVADDEHAGELAERRPLPAARSRARSATTPRPPYSFGQCRQAQPASAFFFCQAFATSSMLAPFSAVRPSEDFAQFVLILLRRVGVDPGPGLGAERGFLRGVVEVHGRGPSTSWSSSAGGVAQRTAVDPIRSCSVDGPGSMLRIARGLTITNVQAAFFLRMRSIS